MRKQCNVDDFEWETINNYINIEASEDGLIAVSYAQKQYEGFRRLRLCIGQEELQEWLLEQREGGELSVSLSSRRTYKYVLTSLSLVWCYKVDAKNSHPKRTPIYDEGAGVKPLAGSQNGTRKGRPKTNTSPSGDLQYRFHTMYTWPFDTFCSIWRTRTWPKAFV